MDLLATMVHDLAVNIYEELHPLPDPTASTEPTLPDFSHPKYLNYHVYPPWPGRPGRILGGDEDIWGCGGI